MPRDLDQVVRSLNLEQVRDEILAVSTPSIALDAEPLESQGEMPIGASRIGGLPDLRPDEPWPTRDGRPLAFLAQLRLSDLVDAAPQPNPLPSRGVLLFFYDILAQPWGHDPADADAIRVLFDAEESTPRAPRVLPQALPKDADEWFIEDWLPFAAASVTPRSASTVDQSRIPLLLEHHSDEAHEAAWAIAEQVNGEAGNGHHRVLGYQTQVQNDAREQCQLASNGVYIGGPIPDEQQSRADELLRHKDDWLLLLQLDSDHRGPFDIWGHDTGCFSFWIRQQDLAARDFSKCWYDLQCC